MSIGVGFSRGTPSAGRHQLVELIVQRMRHFDDRVQREHRVRIVVLVPRDRRLAVGRLAVEGHRRQLGARAFGRRRLQDGQNQRQPRAQQPSIDRYYLIPGGGGSIPGGGKGNLTPRSLRIARICSF